MTQREGTLMWIGDVFGRERAERIDLDELPELFFDTPEMPFLEDPSSHLILGSKGCGKSTVLRALTYRAWRKREPNAPLPFVGVYLPMSYDDINLFKTRFQELQETESFEEFFVASVGAQTCMQLDGQFTADKQAQILHALRKADLLPADVRDLDAAEYFVSRRHSSLRAVREEKLRSQGPLLRLDYLNNFAELISSVSGAAGRKLGLLLDSFDYYGGLASILAPLFESDSGRPLLVKAAGRTIDVSDFTQTSITRPLEIGRDFSLISLDRPTDDQAYARMVRGVICQRVRVFGPPEAQELRDDEVLGAVFHGSNTDPSDLASLDSMSLLSSGNLLAMILMLNEAARLQRQDTVEPPKGMEPLQRNFRLRAVRSQSESFWDYELGTRLPQRRLEAAVFCETALEVAGSSNPENLDSPRFFLRGVSDQNRPLLSELLAKRVLTANDPLLNMKVQSGELVGSAERVEFELNRMLLPKRHRSPAAGPLVDLQGGSFGKRFREALTSTRPHISPRSKHRQAELYRPDFTVFLSVPFDRQKRKRSSILRTAISRLYKESTHQDGGEGVAWVDVHFLPQQGSFREEIPRLIEDATYLVADVTDSAGGAEQTAGVFYEIGLATGLRKPMALFYNSRSGGEKVPPFDPDFLPHLLRGQTVLRWSDEEPSFYASYRKVHEKLNAHLGRLGVPLGGRPLPESERRVPGKHIYVAFQPRHASEALRVESLLRTLYPEVELIHRRDWKQGDAASLCELIAKAGIVLIDCTRGVNESALELGIAYSLNPLATLELWNQRLDRRLNPVSMYPGARFSWTNFEDRELEDLRQAIARLAGASQMGARSL